MSNLAEQPHSTSSTENRNLEIPNLQMSNNPDSRTSEIFIKDLQFNLYVSSFILINFVLTIAILNTKYFIDDSLELQSILGYMFGFLSFSSAGYSLFMIQPQVIFALSKLRVDIYFVIATIYLFSIALSFYWLINNPSEYALNLLAEFLIVNVFLLNMYLVIRERQLLNLSERAQLDLTTSNHKDKLIGNTGGDNANALPYLEKSENTIKIGSILSYRIGDLITTDVLIMEGQAIVLEREFSGRGRYLHKQAGQSLWAGSIVVKGQITCRVESLAVDARINELVPKNDNFQAYWKGQVYFFVTNLFFGLVCLTYWTSHGLGIEFLEPCLGGFIALAILGEWLWIRKTINDYSINSLFFNGIVLKSKDVIDRLVKIKNLFLYNLDPADSKHIRFDKLTILDDRIEDKKLLSLLFAVYSNVQQNCYSQAIIEYFTTDRINGIDLVSEFKIVAQSEQDLIAQIDGALVHIGTEDFMLESSIHIAPGHILKSEFPVLYLALNHNIMAILSFKDVPLLTTDILCSFLNRMNLRSTISGRQSQKEMDIIGANLGYELAQIRASESMEDFRSRLTNVNLAVYSNSISSRDNLGSNVLTISPFSRLRFDPNESDVNLIDCNFRQFLLALAKLYSDKKFVQYFDYAFLFTYLILFAFVSGGYIETELVIFCSIFLLSLSLWTLEKRCIYWTDVNT